MLGVVVDPAIQAGAARLPKIRLDIIGTSWYSSYMTSLPTTVTSLPPTMTTTKVRYIAGAPWLPGTDVPRNVMGECAHSHRSAAAAQACIERTSSAIRRSPGNATAYCDRVVMVQETDGCGRRLRPRVL